MADKWEPVDYYEWEPVDYDGIQVGDEVYLPPQGKTHKVIALRDGKPATSSSTTLNKCCNKWERKIKEQPMDTDTDTNTDTEKPAIYNVWDQDGRWLGTSNGSCYIRSYTYELIPKSDYPKMPIADGVYRVEVDNRGPDYVKFLERKDGKWVHGNGSNVVKDVYNLKILEKYTKETE